MLAKIGAIGAISSLLFLVACQQTSDVQTLESGNDSAEVALQETAEAAAQRLLATFPAQQRAPVDPEVLALGKGLFEINCRACHGPDLRGGDLGGPNLLRSQLVLNDLDGELIIPVVQQGRNNPGMKVMPPISLPRENIAAIAAYIHSVVSTSRGQGSPPPGEEVVLDILVGDADAGKEYFASQCSACHSVTGDLLGIASQISTPEALQDSWVSGRRRGPANPDADPLRRQVTVAVTLTSGEVISGELKRRDDFILSLITTEGKHRSFTLRSNEPGIESIEVNDPLQRHIKLLSEYTDTIMHDVTAYLVTLK